MTRSSPYTLPGLNKQQVSAGSRAYAPSHKQAALEHYRAMPHSHVAAKVPCPYVLSALFSRAAALSVAPATPTVTTSAAAAAASSAPNLATFSAVSFTQLDQIEQTFSFRQGAQDDLSRTQLLLQASDTFSPSTLNPVEQQLLSALSSSPGHTSLSRLVARRASEEQIKQSFASSSFVLGAVLGEGAHGEVFESSMRAGDAAAATHQVAAKSFKGAHSSAMLEREDYMHGTVAAGAQSLKAHFIVPYYGRATIANRDSLVMGRMQGNLGKYAAAITELLGPNYAAISPGVIQLIYRMTLQGLTALKLCDECKVVHRDIKLDNFLTDSEVNTYIADFGVALKLCSSSPFGSQLATTTALHSSAEAAPGNPIGRLDGNDEPRSDVFAFGHMISGLLGQNRLTESHGMIQKAEPSDATITDRGHSVPEIAIHSAQQLSRALATPTGTQLPLSRLEIIEHAVRLMTALKPQRPHAAVLLECLSALDAKLKAVEQQHGENAETMIQEILPDLCGIAECM